MMQKCNNVKTNLAVDLRVTFSAVPLFWSQQLVLVSAWSSVVVSKTKASKQKEGPLICHQWYKHDHHRHTREVRVTNIRQMLSKCVHLHCNATLWPFSPPQRHVRELVLQPPSFSRSCTDGMKSWHLWSACPYPWEHKWEDLTQNKACLCIFRSQLTRILGEISY